MIHPHLHRLHTDQRGMLTITNVVAVMLCALLIAMVMNVGSLIQRKILLQNTADSVAYSGAVWQARAMNALTASNHAIGEMMGMVIVHHAVGGDELEHSTGDQASDANDDLDRAHRILTGVGYSSSKTPAYDTVSADVNAGAAVLAAKIELKVLLEYVYYTKTAAYLMQQSGFYPVVIAGIALEFAMHVVELVILAEYTVLNLWEGAALALVPLKAMLRDQVLPATKQYTDDIVSMAPLLAEEAAQMIAEDNGMEGTLFPIEHPLPVEPDPLRYARTQPSSPPLRSFPALPRPVPPGGGIENLEVTLAGGGAYDFHDIDPRLYDPSVANPPDCNCPSVAADNMRHQLVKTSQLARASFPWVNYHREPIIDRLKILAPLSHAAKHYKEHTEKFSKELCDEFQTDRRQLWLYTVKKSSAPDRGFERWNFPQHSDVADELFSVVGLVHLPAPPVMGVTSFGQSHGDGMISFAQAMVYNANEQEQPAHRIDLDCKRIVPIVQANTGWDTLNWHPGANDVNSNCAAGDREPTRSGEENRPFELIGARTNHHYPRIQVNWQAKLVPCTFTRLQQLASSNLPGPFGPLLEQIPEETTSSMRTH